MDIDFSSQLFDFEKECPRMFFSNIWVGGVDINIPQYCCIWNHWEFLQLKTSGKIVQKEPVDYYTEYFHWEAWRLSLRSRFTSLDYCWEIILMIYHYWHLCMGQPLSGGRVEEWDLELSVITSQNSHYEGVTGQWNRSGKYFNGENIS